MTAEFISATARLLSFGAAAGCVGLAVFFFGCVRSREARPALGTILVVLGCTVCIGHAGILASILQAVAAAGAEMDGLRSLVMDTHVGRVWLWRCLPAVTLLAVSLIPMRDAVKAVLAAGLAAVYLALGPWGGHASGAENLARVGSISIVHVLAISIWLGALPAWLWSVRASVRGEIPAHALWQTLTRFSRLATVLVAVIAASGVWLATLYIKDQGDLLGTRYGVLVVAKAGLLVGALYFANRLRQRSLPALRTATPGPDVARRALRYVSIEMASAAGALACAAWLAQTTPALHEAQPQWWLPFRWSPDATWLAPSTKIWVAVGAALLVAGLAVATWKSLRRARIPAAAALVLSGAGIVAWALAVKAYPATYFRSQAPYLTLSVAHGRSLYEANCTSCHGRGGLGDGPLAASLPKLPANMSEPHTALHTAGDMFWWLTHGIPESGMPGFANTTTPEDRWDTINFLRAFSQGYESRILGTGVVPRQAWLGAINFYLEGVAGPSELKGYRETDNVLLVFLGGDSAASRSRVLADAFPALRARRTQVIGVTARRDAGLPDLLPFPVVREGGEEIWSAYQLLTRTIANRGAPDQIGMEWTHAEFLIDRFGYIRGRWIPEEDPVGWSDPSSLRGALDTLNAEPQLKPSPDDHIH